MFFIKDLNIYINECKAILEGLGIKYGNVKSFTISTRAKSRLGACKKTGLNSFEISISKFILEDNVDTQVLKNTIMHELLHTVKGCFTHKGKWKLLSQIINETYPEYNIKRTINLKEVGVEINGKEPTFRYVLKCEKCGCEIKRQKLSKAVINYKNYRCGKCGGKLNRIS